MKTIKKGQEFECVKDYEMLDGVIAYKAGKKYLSEDDNCLTDEQGRKSHKMDLNDKFYEHFKLIEFMKTQEIIIPAGCKIAKIDVIDDKKLIVTYEVDLLESVEGIKDRYWFINSDGLVEKRYGLEPHQFSTSERAEGILALGQIMELASYLGATNFTWDMEFGANTSELREIFKEKYSELIEKTKKIL